MLNDWLSKISKDVQPSYLSASKDQLEIKHEIALHVRIGDLFTYVLFTVVQNFAIHLLLGIDFIGEHILASLPDGQNAIVRKPTQIDIVKQPICVLTKSHKT